MANQDSPASASGLKLPLLFTARPGNVGVQIDAHRSMNLFTHPRSVKFTSQFHGVMFENGSLENYSRVVERTAQRARLVEDKLEKLRAWEHHLLEDDEKRKQRRIQRESSRLRRMWQMHQAAKRADERAREVDAAIAVQKVIRGALARRAARVLKQVRATYEAATMLQRAMKMYTCRQQLEREREHRARQEEERRELEMHSAAAVLQRQARKRLDAVRQTALAACTEDDEDDGDEDEAEEALPVLYQPPEEAALRVGDLLSDEKIIADALSRGISLDLLFSDDEDGETSSSASSVAVAENEPPQPLRILPQPPANAAVRPRRPMSIKRVGGGYRTKLLPHDATNPSPAIETAPVTARTRTWQEARAPCSSGVSDDFLRHPQRSLALPTAASSTHTPQSPTTFTKSDGDELRAAKSPVKTSM